MAKSGLTPAAAMTASDSADREANRSDRNGDSDQLP